METGIPLVVMRPIDEFAGQTVVNLVPRYEKPDSDADFQQMGRSGRAAAHRLRSFREKLADILIKIKPPYTVNMAALVAARESLRDREYLLGTVKKMIEERERLMEKLRTISFLRPIPSRANYILCEVVRGQAKAIQDEMEKQGILVRYYDTSLLRNYIRISVGKPEHTDRVMYVLRKMAVKS